MDKDLTTTNILHVDDFVEKVSKEVGDATKNAEDASRLINRVSSLAQLKFMLGDRLLLLINHILKPHGHELKLKSERDNDEDLCNAFDNIVDDFGRKIDNYLQEAQGKKVEDEAIIKTKEYDASKKNKPEPSEMSLATVVKPQAFFKIKVDNSSTPFVPLIFEKPNALMPLEESLRKDKDGDFYPHPYQFELDHFEPSKDQLMKVEPQLPRDMRNTPLTYIDTEDKLDKLIYKLKDVPEIAVDLEHHSQRSYLGFTCLMQISTRYEDFIIDAIALRHLMYKFNVIFTDPSIVKVLHGSDFDVIWLQKDFGVYLVNTFDTGLASRTLKFDYFSYAYVLKKYCGVTANKAYQMADWRIRPLKDEMVKYAREDTHYLLYIYDMMRNELIDGNNGFHGLLQMVIQNSTNLCKKRYEKPYLREDAHFDLLKNSNFVPNAKQQEVLKKLYQWRDGMAREQDESTGFILPNQKLLTIVKMMPKEIGGVIACLDQSKFGVAESIHRIISSVLSAPENDIEEAKVLCETSLPQNITPLNKVEESIFDMRGVNKSDFIEEDLIVKALVNVRVRETPMKTQSSQVLRRQPSKMPSAMDILSKLRNPLIMSWPDSFLVGSACKDVENVVYKLKPHTVKKSGNKASACPEVIETKPVMLLDDFSTDKMLKTIRAQIRETEGAPKRKAEESAERVQKKKNKKEAEEVKATDENLQIDSHEYNEEEWQKMFAGGQESTGKRQGKNNKRKANDSHTGGNKKMKMPGNARGSKSFTFVPKDGKSSQAPGRPSAPRIPWPGKK